VIVLRSGSSRTGVLVDPRGLVKCEHPGSTRHSEPVQELVDITRLLPVWKFHLEYLQVDVFFGAVRARWEGVLIRLGTVGLHERLK
jgi:hypothetical protein